MSMIRKVNLANNRMLYKLDTFARAFYKMPHVFTSSPAPLVTYARLEELKQDLLFDGVPEEHNYVDFSAASAGPPYNALRPGQGGTPNHNKNDFQVVKHFLKETFKAGIPNGAHTAWYLDTLCVQGPKVGFTGWHNNWKKPHHSIRFIHNRSSGYTLFRYGNDQIKLIDAPGWTCIFSTYPPTGEVWMCDRNTGASPRMVIDFAIPPRYGKMAENVVEFIESEAS
jgi:hypothetical protein